MTGDIIRNINEFAENRVPFLLLVDFEMRNPLLFPMAGLPGDIRFETPALSGRKDSAGSLPGKNARAPQTFVFRADPVEYADYCRAYSLVRDNALVGNTYLANLTFPAEIRTDLDLESIYRFSRAKYKLLFRDGFVVFSPETFVRIRGGKIFSHPMKGTIDADLPGARQIILADEKERAEHATIVDLIRNDLSIHARNVRVTRFRYTDTIETSHKTLLQVSSEISGDLPEGYESALGEILFSMLPPGSVSGAPKRETLRIIREAEKGPRGYYTGIMGYYDGRDFDSAVMIRYIEKKDGRMIFRSGGGITHMSDPEKEYREMIDKIYVPIA